MKIADDRCHRVLAYLEAVQRHGYTPTVAQVNGYASRATRRARGISEMLADFAAVMPKIQESPLIWLYRVQWVDIQGEGEEIEDENTVTITPLGRAALTALEEEAEASRVEAPIAIALDKDDPMALAKVIGRLAEAGPSALVDRYFSEQVFLAVVQRTEVERLLTGPHPKSRIAAIEQALADFSIERSFEVRVDEEDEHHDRFLIPDDGSVWALGAGVGGVGIRHSAMTEIKDASVVSGIRENFERAWEEARPLNPAPEPTSLEPKKKEAGGGENPD